MSLNAFTREWQAPERPQPLQATFEPDQLGLRRPARLLEGFPAAVLL